MANVGGWMLWVSYCDDAGHSSWKNKRHGTRTPQKLQLKPPKNPYSYDAIWDAFFGHPAQNGRKHFDETCS